MKRLATGCLLAARPSRRRAFTLIELMTVVVILAILAALLLPALFAVSHRSKVADSLNRMRLLSGAIFTYSADHDQRFPGGGVSGDSRWYHQVAPYLGVPSDKSVQGVPIYSHAYDLEQFITCPVLHGRAIEGTNTTYMARFGMNRYLAVDNELIGAPLSRVNRPPETVLLATKANPAPGLHPAAYPAHPWGISPNYEMHADPEQGPSADGTIGKHAYVFCDGHVEVRTKVIDPLYFGPTIK